MYIIVLYMYFWFEKKTSFTLGLLYGVRKREKTTSKWDSVREAFANAAKNGWVAFKKTLVTRDKILSQTILNTQAMRHIQRCRANLPNSNTFSKLRSLMKLEFQMISQNL